MAARGQRDHKEVAGSRGKTTVPRGSPSVLNAEFHLFESLRDKQAPGAQSRCSADLDSCTLFRCALATWRLAGGPLEQTVWGHPSSEEACFAEHWSPGEPRPCLCQIGMGTGSVALRQIGGQQQGMYSHTGYTSPAGETAAQFAAGSAAGSVLEAAAAASAPARRCTGRCTSPLRAAWQAGRSCHPSVACNSRRKIKGINNVRLSS